MITNQNNLFNSYSKLSHEEDIQNIESHIIEMEPSEVFCNDVLNHVFSYLHFTDVPNKINLVNKQWHYISSHSYFVWKQAPLPKEFFGYPKHCIKNYWQSYLNLLKFPQMVKQHYRKIEIPAPFGGYVTYFKVLNGKLTFVTSKGYKANIELEKLYADLVLKCASTQFITHFDQLDDLFTLASKPRKDSPNVLTIGLFQNQANKDICLDGPIHALKLHPIESNKQKGIILFVHQSNNELVLFDCKDINSIKVIFSKKNVLSFDIHDQYIALIRKGQSKNKLTLYSLSKIYFENQGMPYCQKIDKDYTVVSMNQDALVIGGQNKILSWNLQNVDLQYMFCPLSVSRQTSLIKFSAYDLPHTFQKITNIWSFKDLTLAAASEYEQFRSVKFNSHPILAVFKKGRLISHFALDKHFTSIQQITLVDKKIFVLASQSDKSHLACYDFSPTYHIAKLAKQVDLCGLSSLTAYLLDQKKGTLLTLISLLLVTKFYVLPESYTLTNFVDFLIRNLKSSGLHSLFLVLFNYRDLLKTENLFNQSIFNRFIASDVGYFLIENYLKWRIQNVHDEYRMCRKQAKELLNYYEAFSENICPITKKPIRFPMKFEGQIFEMDKIVEWLAYRFLISGINEWSKLEFDEQLFLKIELKLQSIKSDNRQLLRKLQHSGLNLSQSEMEHLDPTLKMKAEEDEPTAHPLGYRYA